MKKILLSVSVLTFLQSSLCAQKEQKISAILFEGTVVAGYADDGAFINFTGPAVKMVRKPHWSLAFGMLPSLRIKEDQATAPAKRNATVWPALGTGFTFVFNHLALQLPVYYNAKTSTANGKWKAGAGIGYKF